MRSNRKKELTFALCGLLLLLPVLTLSAQVPEQVERGIRLYQQRSYIDALREFRTLISRSDLESFYDQAYFWVAKTYIAMGDYEEAEVNLEYFLAEFPESRLYPEGEYQKGRLLYLQREFEAAIQVLYGFVNRYPEDPYVSNGFFWIGESLYSLGNFDEAETVYTHIVDSYPESFKIEAARYRLQLIQFKHRENELVKLLKISHEEYLRAVEEFLQREKAYEQALTEYQKRIAVVMSEDLQSEFDELNAELKEKQALIDRLQRENQQLASQVNTQAPAQATQPAPRIAPTDTERVRELLEMKAEALELKEFYLGLIEKDGPGQ